MKNQLKILPIFTEKI